MGGGMKQVKYFRCLLTEQEESILKSLSQNNGLSKAEFIKMLVKNEAKERGLLLRPGKYAMIGEGGSRLG